MDGWQVLAVIASVVFAGAMLRLVWVAAFHPGDTVSTVPELDGYGRGQRSGAQVGQSPKEDSPTGPRRPRRDRTKPTR